MKKRPTLILEQLEDRIFFDANPLVVINTEEFVSAEDIVQPPLVETPPIVTIEGDSDSNSVEEQEGPEAVALEPVVSEEEQENEVVMSTTTDGMGTTTASPEELPAENISEDNESSPSSAIVNSDKEHAHEVVTDSSIDGEVVEVLDPLIGEQFTFTVTLDNPTTDTLYGPYIDLYFESGSSNTAGDETNPADPDNDGIVFDGATYLGVDLTPPQSEWLVYDGSTPLLHPYAVDIKGDPVEITTNPDGTALQENDTLVVLQMPFGSYTPGQAPAEVVVTAHISEYSMIDLAQGATEDLNVQVSNGFQFGTDELQNPATDPSVTNLNTSINTYRPEVLAFDKNYIGPEQETATGPNYPRQYTIQVDIANGQTISNLALTDLLPDEIYFLGTSSVVNSSGTPVGYTETITSTASQNTDSDSATYTNGELQITLTNPITGSSAANDLTFTFDFYVPEFYLDGTTSILGGACSEADTPIVNDAKIEGDWTPTDPDDQGPHHFVYDTEVNLDTNSPRYGEFGGDPSNDEQITAKSIAVQKNVALSTDTDSSGGYSPGDIIRYDLQIQISDYLSFGNIEVVDTMSDGLELYTAGGLTPSLSVVEQGATAQVTTFDITDTTEYESNFVFSAGHFDRQLQFHVSQTMLNDDAVFTDNSFSDGVLEGGYTNGLNGPATTMMLTYYAQINDEYISALPPIPGNDSVDQGDVLDNNVVVSANVYGYAAGSLVNVALCPEDDSSSASVEINTGTAQKEFYRVNGLDPAGDTHIAPGDLVTFRLTYALPTSDVELFSLTDYLPKPVFDALSVSTFDPTVSADLPGVGVAKFGVNDTFYALSNIAPTITTSGPENTIIFNYGNYDAPEGTGQSTVEILFTVEVSNDPFADGLYLTNMLVTTESGTQHQATDDQEIAGFTLDQPELSITKGVIEAGSVSDTGEVVGDEGAIFWNPLVTDPTTTGFRFTGGDGVVDSADLLANPVDDNLTGADAYDYVSYAIVVENKGHYNAFDIEINDVLPDGHTAADVSNLTITDGNGVAIGWSGSLFAGGIELNDSTGYGAAGLEHVDNADGGHNVVIITYDLLLSSVIAPSEILTNTASLTHYTSAEGYSESFIDPSAPLTDDATVTTKDPLFVKEIIDTNQSHTAGNDVVVGEIVTYRVTMTLPEGTMYADPGSGDGLGVALTDTLDSGLALVSGSMTITASAGLTSSNGPFDATMIANHLTVDAQGAGFNLDFGEVTNTNNVNPTLETIIVDYDVAVLNVSSNVTGQSLDNQATFYYDQADGSDHQITTDAPDVSVVEPELTVTKTVSDATPDAGDIIDFTITITNSEAVTAFDVSLADTMPLNGLTLQNNLVIRDSLGNDISWTGASGDNVAADFYTSRGITLWDRGVDSLNLDGDVGFDSGDALTITFSAAVDSAVHVGEDLTNCVDIEWESLESDGVVSSTYNADAVERTGDDRAGVASDAGEMNNYTTRDCATVTTASPELVKTIIGTDQAFTGNDPGGNPYLVIGEKIQYQVVIDISEGSTYDFTVTDTLDQGLALVSVDSISSNSNDLTSTVSGGVIGTDPTIYFQESVTTASDGQILQMNFGTIRNDNIDNATPEQITLTYTAVVLNTSDGLTDRGDLLGNSVTASWDRIDADPNTAPDFGSVTVVAPDATVVEPELTVLKTVDNSSPDAGDTVTFTIDITNPVVDDTYPDAFDVNLEDILPTGFTYIAPSLTYISGVAPTQLSGGATVSATWASFASGATSRFSFQATVDQAVSPLQDLTNSVDIQWESLPEDFDSTDTSDDLSVYNVLSQERTGDTTEIGGAANDYTATDDAAVAIPDLQIAKTAVGNYTIGQDVTFTVTVTLPESIVPSLVVTDTLPAGLIVDNPAMDIVIIPDAGFGTLNAPTITNATTPDTTAVDTLSLDFGQVVVDGDPGSTNNTFDIQITARVENIIGNADSSSLTNTAYLSYKDSAGVSHDVGPATAVITLVEPEITTTKTIVDSDNVGQGQDDGNTHTADVLGDIFTATTTFTNTGTSNAYDIILTDALAPGTTFDPASLVFTEPARWASSLVENTNYTLSYDNSDPTDPNFSIAITDPNLFLAQGEVLELEYKFLVQEAWFVEGTHRNLIDANWSSMPGTSTGERIYDDTAANNPGMSQDAASLPVETENDKASDYFTVPAADGSLGDFVFYDINNNGTMDIGTDIGIPGVQVISTIIVGANTYTAVATTNNNGEYTFTHLPTADYTVHVNTPTLPAGAIQVYEHDTSIDNNIVATVISPNANLDADFGYIGDGSIGDYIWYDGNNNGLQDDPAGGINGATVELHADLNGDGTVDYTRTTTTINSPTGDPGYYIFENLLYSDYTITVTALPGDINDYTQTADPDTMLNNTGTVTVADWTIDTDKFIDDQDFGYIQGASIGNFVWDDLNGDGLQLGEAGIGGVRIVLSGLDINGNSRTMNTVTATNGSYQFAGLIAGTYTITVDETSLPSDYLQSYDYLWDTTDGLNNTATYTLATNETFNDLDFGYTKTGSIGDTVWFDANANGMQDSGEPGLSGVEITLSGDVDLDGITDTLTINTNAAGQYLFDDLPTGIYDITVTPTTLPGGMTPTYDVDGIDSANTANINLAYGEDKRDVDFGYTGTGSIGDTVWYDANRNSLQDVGESGIANVLITLNGDINADGVNDYTTDIRTDGGGSYLFENLPAGRYTITVDPSTLPADLIQTYDPDSLMDGTSAINLGAGENNLNQDFGYALPPEPPVTAKPPEPPEPILPPNPLFPETPVNRDGESDVDAFLEGPALSQRTNVVQPALTSIPAMYTGHAEPGTMLRLTMYDAQGNVLATQMVPADTGGNWLANLQIRPDSETPHSIVIQQSAAVYNRSSEGGFNLRTHFSPSFGSKAVTHVQGDASSIMGGLAEHVVENLHKLYNGQVDVRWDSTSPYESSVTSTNPGQSNTL